MTTASRHGGGGGGGGNAGGGFDLPVEAIDQYLFVLEQQCALVSGLGNNGQYGEAMGVLRIAHDKLKDLMELADASIERWEHNSEVPKALLEEPRAAAASATSEIDAGPAAANKKWQRWTASEDRLLEEAVERFGRKQLERLAMHVGTKTSAQCRERLRRQRREASSTAAAVIPSGPATKGHHHPGVAVSTNSSTTLS